MRLFGRGDKAAAETEKIDVHRFPARIFCGCFFVLISGEGLVLDGSTGKVISIDAAPILREADDPFRADVVRWAALDVPSIMVEKDLKKLREAYRVPVDIELMLPKPNERACFPRRGCTVLHLNAFVSGMGLPVHPLFRSIEGLWLGFDSSCPKRMELDGRGHVFVVSAHLRHGNAFACVPHYLSAEEVVEEKGQWKESWFWVSGNWQRVDDNPEPDLDVPNSLPRCELSRNVVDVVWSIYQVDPLNWRYRLILNRHRCLIELGLMASNAEMDQERCPRLTLARLTKQRPRVLVPGSTEDTLQKKVIEDLSREGSREEVAAPDVVEVEDAGVPEGEAPLKRKRNSGTSGAGPSQPKKKAVVLESPPRVDPISGESRVGPFDSRKKLRELNKEKRRLQDKSESRELEAQSLRGDLEVSEKGRKEAEAEVARLLGEKKEI
ncbi:Uncharacterized protein Adt_04489 [Abeliophyllum distichum]|uniref:Uncharacterized protein n=1 Tax=Abeliophyllum distichum TaxID=126358 RepID=A0ABD1V3F8_9LAMI